MRQFTFWLAVGGVSILTDVAVNVLADKYPNSGFATLNDFRTRRNG